MDYKLDQERGDFNNVNNCWTIMTGFIMGNLIGSINEIKLSAWANKWAHVGKPDSNTFVAQMTIG